MKGHSKQPLISFENSEKLVSSEEVKGKVEDVAKQTGDKIKKGLENPTASTGTPIDSLSGGAKFMAQLSNIGGGSKATGGGGIQDGFNTVNTNTEANTVLKVLDGENYIQESEDVNK